MSWLRLHTDILSDPKLMRAARAGAKQLHLTPWLLAFAKQADDGGRLSIGGEAAAEPRDIAATVPCVTAKMVERCQEELLVIGVLVEDDDGVLRFSRWESRQSKPSARPAAVAERVRRHRSKPDVMPPSPTGSGRYRNTPNRPRRGVTETHTEERRGAELKSSAPEENQISEKIPVLSGSAPERATPQELLERREHLRVGFRDLQAQEATP